MVDQPDRILELTKAILYTNSPGAPGKRAKFVWSTKSGNFRSTVFTNDPSDKDNGMISVPYDSTTFHFVLSMMDHVLKSAPDTKQKLDVRVRKYENGQATDEKIHLGTLYVGKNKDGINWISLVSPDPVRPKIVFEYQVNDLCFYYKEDGSQLSKAELSDLSLAANINMMRKFHERYFLEVAKKTTPGVASDPGPSSSSAIFEDVNF